MSGYFKELYVANNGVEGVELYNQKHPDIVLADISMPLMDGLEMSKVIRKQNPNQKIVLFTSYNDVSSLSKAIEINVNKYIMKPLNYRELFDTLNLMIELLRNEQKDEAYKRDLEFASNHDLLTGLANRKLFFTQLRQLVAQSHKEQKSVAILSMDLNKFKPINDTYGHDAGDLILKKVAEFLQDSLQKLDIVSRFGGDEFVVAVGFLKEKNHILNFLERLERSFSRSIRYVDDEKVEHSLEVGFSAGITFTSPSARISFDTLLRQADKAMYRAKELSIPYSFFDKNEESKFQVKAKKTQLFRDAIDRGELMLYYQPIMNIENNEIVGCEALLRWKHPRKGILTPDRFLPYIWKNLEIGVYLASWVMEEVFIFQKKLIKDGKKQYVSINISFNEFNAKEFTFALKKMIWKYPIVDPSLISFEIDEETALQDMKLEKSHISEIRELGFKITLDDFGKGTTTLLNLQKMNVDALKIDKSFVVDMLVNRENHSIVDASIKLAKVFDYKVIALGVESKEHLPNLLALGCDEAQGYGIAKPMPEWEFDDEVKR